MSDMDIRCRRCGARIRADDVNIETMIANCRSCDAIFSLAAQFTLADKSAPITRLDVPRPRCFTVEHLDGTLRISWRGSKGGAIILLLVTLIWNGFASLWIFLAFSSAGHAAFALAAIPHLLIGLWLGRLTLSNLLNTTRVEASASDLRVYNTPISASNNLSIPRDSLRQFYCVEPGHHSRRGPSGLCDLWAIKADGSSIAVLKSLADPEQALYLEQELERYLRIKDEPVDGELPR